jgi:CubicO group peptidase (beta-lactamase class C family)
MTTDAPRSPRAWSGTAKVVRGTTVLEQTSAGFAAQDGGPPCSDRLRFQAGSISKLVVSVVVLRLVELGTLSLDAPIHRWLRDAPQAWDTVTLRHLLGQTSGIGHWGDVGGLPGTFLTSPPARDELVALIAASPLLSAPGRDWRYSGPGYLVATLVVEASTGTGYGDVAAGLVLAPAGLRASTSGQVPTTSADVALGHRAGELVPLDEGFTHLPGTGDLWTTVDDLVTLNQALRTGLLLGPETAEQLWIPRAVTGSAEQEGAVVVEAYGYGTFLGRVRGHPARIHPGDNPGYQSLLAYLPDVDVDVVVLGNDEAPGVDVALEGLRSL